MDTNDNINDVMVIMTDGWDSDLVSLQANINSAASDGITTLVVGFGAGGFYNTWSLLDMAQGNSNNLFIVSKTQHVGKIMAVKAQTAEALESITPTVFDGVCTANALSAVKAAQSYSLPAVPENVFLLEAAATYLDIFGFLPNWTPGLN